MIKQYVYECLGIFGDCFFKSYFVDAVTICSQLNFIYVSMSKAKDPSSTNVRDFSSKIT